MMTETVVNVQEAPNNNTANKPQPTSQTADSPFAWIKINLDYFKTLPGLLKIAEFYLMSVFITAWLSENVTIVDDELIDTWTYTVVYKHREQIDVALAIQQLQEELVGIDEEARFRILGILCMSLASPAFYSGTHFFLFVVTTSFIGTLLWIFIYLLGVREAVNVPIDWILTELLNTGICTVFYIIAFIIQLIVGATMHTLHSYRAMYIAAGVFGLFNAGVYSFATYLLSLQWKSSRTTN